jgi:ketosteroid isomerase-like protein
MGQPQAGQDGHANLFGVIGAEGAFGLMDNGAEPAGETPGARHAWVRQTDCFERRDGAWKLFHQHASSPVGGEWDGRIITA